MSAGVSVPSWFPSRYVTFGTALTTLASAPFEPRTFGFAAMMSAIDGGVISGGYVQVSTRSPSRMTSWNRPAFAATHASAEDEVALVNARLVPARVRMVADVDVAEHTYASVRQGNLRFRPTA